MSDDDRCARSGEPAGGGPEARADRHTSSLECYLAAVAGEHARGPLPGRPAWRWDRDTVRDVMRADVLVVTATASFRHIVGALARNRVSAVPVVDGAGRVLGVVSDSDLLARVAVDGDRHPADGGRDADHAPRAVDAVRPVDEPATREAVDETAADLMSVPAITVHPADSVFHAARVAARAHVRWLPVVSADNRIVGTVTRADLLRVFLRGDEEIRDYLTGEVGTSRLLDTATIRVDVRDGVVTLGGRLDRRRLVAPLLETARRIAGVVAVDDQLSYAAEDTVVLPAQRVPLY